MRPITFICRAEACLIWPGDYLLIGNTFYRVDKIQPNPGKHSIKIKCHPRGDKKRKLTIKCPGNTLFGLYNKRVPLKIVDGVEVNG